MDGNDGVQLFYLFGFLLFVVTRSCVFDDIIFGQLDGALPGEPTPNPVGPGDSVVGLVGIHHLVAVQPVPGRTFRRKI